MTPPHRYGSHHHHISLLLHAQDIRLSDGHSHIVWDIISERGFTEIKRAALSGQRAKKKRTGHNTIWEPLTRKEEGDLPKLFHTV
jgi:hypothetical protein